MRSAAVCGACVAWLMGDDPETGAQRLAPPDDPTSRAILAYVCGYFDRFGHAPSHRAIAAVVGCGVATVHDRLHQLRDSGHVTFADRIPRTLVVNA